ncbi:MAG: FIST N-terminal domain-containing protein [Cyanobacteria bacterium P01_H01_bin.121]
MKWVSHLSTRPSLEAALQEIADAIGPELAASADLGLLFVSAMFTSEYPRVMPLLQEYLKIPVIVGCGGGGIIGGDPGATQEVEDEPAIALCLASLPGVEVKPFWIAEDQIPDLDSPPQAWIDCVGVDPADQPCFLVFSDPMAARINDLLQGLDFAYPESPKVGGLASGATTRGGNTLFFNDRARTGGTVGVALSGNIELRTIVAQGCRPIGPVFRVTEGERNILLQVEYEDQPDQKALAPLEALQAVVADLDDRERELAQNSLFVGIAHSEFQAELEPGDFLVRNLLGVDPRIGAMAIGDRVRPGRRVQFHLRDAATSAEDLEALLQRYQKRPQNLNPSGAVLFSCLGRGINLYEQPNFDSQLFHQQLGHVPLTGFFCNGEIGPIGGSTYLHGYTSVFGIFYQTQA